MKPIFTGTISDIRNFHANCKKPENYLYQISQFDYKSNEGPINQFDYKYDALPYSEIKKLIKKEEEYSINIVKRGLKRLKRVHSGKLEGIDDMGEFVAIVSGCDIKGNKFQFKGISKLNKTDEYDMRLGKYLALARALDRALLHFAVDRDDYMDNALNYEEVMMMVM